jgi:hypothetical protein
MSAEDDRAFHLERAEQCRKMAEQAEDPAGRKLHVELFGAIGDGDSHPLSEPYASLAAAQAIYPHATALTDEIYWAAAQSAVTEAIAVEPALAPNVRGQDIHFPKGVFVFNRKLDLSDSKGVTVRGAGTLTGANIEGGTMLLFTAAGYTTLFAVKSFQNFALFSAVAMPALAAYA